MGTALYGLFFCLAARDSEPFLLQQAGCASLRPLRRKLYEHEIAPVCKAGAILPTLRANLLR